MQDQDQTKESSYSNGETKSIHTNGNGTQETLPATRRKSTPVAGPVIPILVSEQQFETVKQEHLTSMGLLNSAGMSLQRALDQMIPPEGSGRVVGEYMAQGIRQIAKSICDLTHTKVSVVRQMYSIARDEV